MIESTALLLLMLLFGGHLATVPRSSDSSSRKPAAAEALWGWLAAGRARLSYFYNRGCSLTPDRLSLEYNTEGPSFSSIFSLPKPSIAIVCNVERASRVFWKLQRVDQPALLKSVKRRGGDKTELETIKSVLKL